MIYGGIPSLSKHDESTRGWFIFGTNPKTGLVDVSDGERDVATDVSVESAEKLIAAKQRFNDEIAAIVATFHVP